MKRFFVRLVVLTLTMYLLPLADYVVSWFGDLVSVAHAATCSVSSLCGSRGAKDTTASTVSEGKIITCIVGDNKYQDKRCNGSAGVLITPIYTTTGEPVSKTYEYMEIDESDLSGNIKKCNR